MKYSYISILTTDNYLFGALVLWKSLLDTKPKYPFHLLVSPNLSDETFFLLEKSGVPLIKITPIKNPILNNPKDRRYYNYSKLNMWNLKQFDKIVYLDADMVVMHNIDELFGKPNLSSTNSGGWLPGKKDWTKMNSGLIVLQPSENIFNHMKSQVGFIEKEKGKGDQAFLHEYYNDWPERPELHLPHVYNVFDCLIEGYKKHFQYYLDEKIQYDNNKFDEKRIKIVHYVGQHKPWMEVEEIKNSNKNDPETQAKKIWIKYYKNTKKFIRDRINESNKKATNNVSIVKDKEVEENKAPPPPAGPEISKEEEKILDNLSENSSDSEDEDIGELTKTKAELVKTQDELAKAQEELMNAKEDLAKSQNEIKKLLEELALIKGEDDLAKTIDNLPILEELQELTNGPVPSLKSDDDPDEPIESDVDST